jgi:hypothetical protein
MELFGSLLDQFVSSFDRAYVLSTSEFDVAPFATNWIFLLGHVRCFHKW